MDDINHSYLKDLHQPPVAMSSTDQELFKEYFKVAMSGLLGNHEWVSEVGWRVLTRNAADLAHEMVSAHHAKFK